MKGFFRVDEKGFFSRRVPALLKCLSLIIVVCFAVSSGFALLSAAIARLVLTLLSCIACWRLHASNSAVFRLLSEAASLFFR